MGKNRTSVLLEADKGQFFGESAESGETLQENYRFCQNQ